MACPILNISPIRSFFSGLGTSASTPVTVLAVFGKSRRPRGSEKARIWEEMTQKSVFNVEGSSCISCYHDVRFNRVYLHFVNPFSDAAELLGECTKAEEKMESGVCTFHVSCLRVPALMLFPQHFQGFQGFLADRSMEFARALLFLFHAAHLVVLYHPGHSFDLSYVQLFKAVDAFR